MKAIVYNTYGGPEVLQLKEVNKPQPKDNELLIRIKATAVNSGDYRLRKADPFAVRFFFGLTKPKKQILGGVLSGVIEHTGKDVKLFNVGDEVFGSAGMRFGTYAEYVCLPETAVLSLKPVNLSHTEAAVIPFGGTTALYFIKKAKIKSGQKVLIYGASGAIGTAAIQLAKYFGAEVTAVCSTSNLEMVRSLGADHVIDYTKENFNDRGEKYDVIYETVNKLPVSECLKSLKKDGTLLLGAAMLKQMLRGCLVAMVGKQKVIFGVIKESAEDIAFLRWLIETDRLRSVIDKTFPLEKMAEAHAYVEKGHKKGNVAVEIN
ncbi:MAG: NADPH:quinone reductase [Bacteroidetes bacterium]|nr:NADPH:quinone reductase [Bacteroidota bacterium]